MSAGKSSVSRASSYLEMGEYWDEHDVEGAWDPERRVEIDFAIETDRHYFSIERGLSKKVLEAARSRGVSAETLLNLWVQEKLGLAGA